MLCGAVRRETERVEAEEGRSGGNRWQHCTRDKETEKRRTGRQAKRRSQKGNERSREQENRRTREQAEETEDELKVAVTVTVTVTAPALVQREDGRAGARCMDAKEKGKQTDTDCQ